MSDLISLANNRSDELDTLRARLAACERERDEAVRLLTDEVADLRDDLAAGEQGRAYLRTLIEEAQRGQRKAEAEVARLRALVEDACHHLDALGQTGKSWAKSFRAELAGE